MKYIVSIGPDHFEVNEVSEAMALVSVLDYIEETGEVDHMIGGTLSITASELPSVGLELGEVRRTGF